MSGFDFVNEEPELRRVFDDGDTSDSEVLYIDADEADEAMFGGDDDEMIDSNEDFGPDGAILMDIDEDSADEALFVPDNADRAMDDAADDRAVFAAAVEGLSDDVERVAVAAADDRAVAVVAVQEMPVNAPENPKNVWMVIDFNVVGEDDIPDAAAAAAAEPDLTADYQYGDGASLELRNLRRSFVKEHLNYADDHWKLVSCVCISFLIL